MVSLGTGSTSAKQTPSEDLPALWQNSFPVRIFRAFWKQGDADEAWRHLIAPRELESKDKFFRFDVNFNQRPPSLDDVDRMSEVARMAREAVLGSSAIENLARRIRAELFVFEPSCSFSSSIALTYQNFVAAIFNVSDSSSAVCVLGQMS